MNRNALASVFVAALVLLAGCSAGTTGGGGDVSTDGTATAMDSTSAGSGTMHLYISDEQNAIGDFEHLNVTITRVGLKPAGEDDERAETEDDESEDGVEAETEEEPEDDDANETVTNETATSTATPTAESDDEVDDAEEGDEVDDAEEGDDAEWVEYQVDNRTVDLTRLEGANATRLSSFDVPNGTYEGVFVYVSEVNGTLKDGSSQRVKLPSGKLKLNSEFTVGDGESVDFVFDVTAVEAGQSGKYVLKPVISESGTDVKIDSVDDDHEEDEDEDGERGDEADDHREAETSALNASFVGNVTRGENATLSVTRNGSAVANASVTVDDEVVGTTDADGRLTLSIPEDAEEYAVTVRKGDSEAELEFEFESDDESGSNSGANGSGGGQSAAS